MGHLKTQDIHHDILIAELETYGLDQTSFVYVNKLPQ